MKYSVTVQVTEYHEKTFTIDAFNEEIAKAEAISSAQMDMNEDEPYEGWDFLDADFDVYADIEEIK